MTTFSSTRWPLSSAQLAIWSAQRRDPASPAHNVAEYVDVNGPVDLPSFEVAVNQAVAEAEALHVRFAVSGDQVWQHVLPAESWRLGIIDVSGEADPFEAAMSWMRVDLARPMDLGRGPLFRQVLFVVGEDRHLWYHRTHNIVLDSYGFFLLNRRVAELYSARGSGEPFEPLRPVIDQDAAYVRSQACVRDREFWMARYADAPIPVGLADRTAPAAPEFLRRSTTLPPSSVEDWAEVADRCGTSWSTVVIATVAAYLRHVTEAPEVVLGLPRVCRRRSVSLNVPCSTLNVVPLRVATPAGAGLRELSRQVADEVIAVWPRERYRSDWLRQEVHPGAPQRRLFGPVVNVNPISYELWFGGHRGTAHSLSSGAVEDLTITVHGGHVGSGPRVDFDANPAVYGADDLTVHLQAFLDLLDTAPAVT